MLLSPNVQRRTCLRAAAVLLGAASGTLAWGQAESTRFPDKTVRIILPYPPGGLSDVLARYIGQMLSDRWHQQVVVDNRPGGGTVIGASAVARSAPDGYNLLLTNNTHVINPHLMTNMPYDSVRDFTPVAMLATSAYLMLVHPDVPARNLTEFIALAKSKPGKINFGTHGAGGLTHVAAELLNSMAGIKMEIVQYKGAGPALSAMLAHEVDVYFDAPATTLQHVQSGKLRALAISGQSRLAGLPQVPTLSEGGVPGFDVTIWYGLIGPANIPQAVVAKINNDVGTVLALPEVKDRLNELGAGAFTLSPAKFSELIRADYDKYGRIIRDAHIKAG